ncbi:MAG: SusC/RagA family TonB-linked outer membrane protein [Bacteroidetes bacterium]|nr:SusC/RagA family TonB-linked outer membrane protein [Bacteroidota bacterium]
MKKFLLLCFSFVFVLSAWAQDRVITGKVSSSEDGSALPGVNVVVKGTTNGTVTDADGKYSISVPADGGALVFSFIGLRTSEVAVGERTVVDVQLSLDVTQLSEVVVTAQGVEKEQKSLGFAQTTISSAALANKPETDVGRALQGKTPGLQVLNSSGLVGSGSKINIRGLSSLSGDTQPLWVVNGVPINTSTNDINGGDFRDGQVSPTRFLDIDPNNIESVSILRGLQATTTYGSQGRNGVILVTTKTGSSGKGQQNKFEGSFNQSYFITQAVVPEYQNKWANGFDGAYGEFFSNWGSLFNGKPTGVRHPYFEHAALFPQFPEFATSATTNGGYIPTPAPNNVSDFFKTGTSSTTSISLAGKTEFGTISFSYSHLTKDGFVKNNDLQRDNFSLGGTAKLTNNLTLNASFNYVKTNTQTPPAGSGTGSNSTGGPSIWANLFYVPRNIDLSRWPFENPVTGGNIYYRNGGDIPNPYWLVKNTRQISTTNRFFSNTSLNYKVTDWLNVTYRLGYDTYTEQGTYYVNKGLAGGISTALQPGALRTTAGVNTVIDQSLILSFNKAITQDLKFTGILGYNVRKDTYNQTGLESLGQVVYGFLEHRNFTSTLPRTFRGAQLNYKQSQSWIGTYLDANLEYKGFLYLNLSGRYDQVSTLIGSNQNLFYPGASVSFIPTAAFPNFGSGVLDFLKIRAAYGTSANFGFPYLVSQQLGLNGQAFTNFAGTNVVASSVSSQLANPNLKPERLVEYEGGIEANMFENRIKLNASAYYRTSEDLQLGIALDPSTGYTSTTINAGGISNKGFEVSITGTPYKTNDWQVDVTLNYTKNISRVDALVGSTTSVGLSGFTTEGNFAEVGQPFNVIKGTYVPRNPSGQLIVNAAGSYATSSNLGIIGDPNPQWFGSGLLNVRWKAITLGAQVDYTAGGQVLSYTVSSLVGRGVSKDLENFDPSLPLVLPGVNEVTDGSGNVTGYTPNTTPLTTAGVFFGNTIIGGGPSDRAIFDATRVRIREISLSYTLPTAMVSKLKLKGVTVSAVANNIWWKAINAPKYTKVDFDRTAFGSGNGAGLDYISGPSAQEYGVNLKISF